MTAAPVEKPLQPQVQSATKRCLAVEERATGLNSLVFMHSIREPETPQGAAKNKEPGEPRNRNTQFTPSEFLPRFSCRAVLSGGAGAADKLAANAGGTQGVEHSGSGLRGLRQECAAVAPGRLHNL